MFVHAVLLVQIYCCGVHGSGFLWFAIAGYWCMVLMKGCDVMWQCCSAVLFG